MSSLHVGDEVMLVPNPQPYKAYYQFAQGFGIVEVVAGASVLVRFTQLFSLQVNEDLLALVNCPHEEEDCQEESA